MRNDSIALIVGGSTGMGFATAKRLLEQGHTIMILSHDASRLEAAKALLNNDDKVETICVDLYDQNQVTQFIDQINKETRHIKYLLNSAGYFQPIAFLDHTDEDYDKQLKLNKAFFFITQAVAVNMKIHGGGSIVNIGSMWAHQAVKATPSSAYSMQKAGLHALTQHLAMELAE